MRTEVKRSLLLWPAAASVAITAMSSFTIDATVSTIRCAKSVASALDAVVLRDDASALATDIELSARQEHGSRAMKLPARVAGVFDASTITLKAPVRNEQHELASLVLMLPSHIEAGDDKSSLVRPDSDVFASRRIISDQIIAADQTIDIDVLPRLRNRKHVQVITQRIHSQPGSLAVDPERLQLAADRTLVASSEQKSMLPRSVRALGKRSPFVIKQSAKSNADSPENPSKNAIGVDSPIVTLHVEKVAADIRGAAERSPAGWPATDRLNEQLQALSALASNDRSVSRDRLVSSSASLSPVVQWSNQVSKRLRALQSLPRLGDPRAGTLINELLDLAGDGQQGAEQLTDRAQQIEWLRASYAVARRQAVWKPVWEVANTAEPAWMVSDLPIARPQSIVDALERVRADLDETGDVNGWAEYLLLDELNEFALAGRSEQRPILAKRFLSRLSWHALDSEQRRWLERDSITQLAAAIRPWARSAVDYANLMSLIERQESDTVDLVAIEIADAVQTLRFADNPKAVRVADAITTHYRNANVRLAISQPMLQRMLPTVESRSAPVRTLMFGSRVRGTSRIESDLRVELNPSTDRWSMSLKATGKVRTESTGINGPVAIRTSGDSDFVAETPIQIDARGVQVAKTDVKVDGNTKLRGIRSDYDRVPMVGSLVRRFAGIRYDSLAGRSNRIANRMIESQVRSEMDTQIEHRLGTAAERFSDKTLEPLRELSLDPRVMDMQTTDQRLLARYRLAGDWQLAAFTPRPRAPTTSLMSMQVHQSALNNTLEKLIPRDEPMPIRDVLRKSAEILGQLDAQVPDDFPEDVAVQFARTRPITIEIEDGQLWVTLRILRLNRGERVALTQFIVRAAYKPQIDGLQVSLVRDGHLRISGPGMSMRERLPVRAIFNKVLSPNRSIRLTPPQIFAHQAAENLVVSQLELRGGWIGIAVSDSGAPRIAAAKK
jgi:hypothetical protein